MGGFKLIPYQGRRIWPHIFAEQKFFFFVKSEFMKTATKNDIRRSTCSQKSDVPHTKLFYVFFV